jgi:TonB family protein
MGYQALLFCPDEKTARTVTQVLSELDFEVVSCTEPFAAVKKLMAVHFDAVVVDCDNEQNATLLFKSARNAPNNQSALAVAVVEGQAGVAKAFRIGANLVLTKPINVEQAKGTLRVARGLLRKNDAAKPAAAATTTAAKVVPPAPAPAKPVSAAPSTSASRPVAAVAPPSPHVPKPAPQTSFAASASSAIHESAEPGESISSSASASQTIEQSKALEPKPEIAPHKPEVIAPLTAGFSVTTSAGSASAAAPARETKPSVIPSSKPAPEVTAPENLTEKHTAAPVVEETASPVPSLSFAGAVESATKSSKSGSKTGLIAVAAIVLIAAGGYAAWTKYGPSNGTNAPASASVRPTPSSVAPTAPAIDAVPLPTAPATPTPTSTPLAQPATTKAVAAPQATSSNEDGQASAARAHSADVSKPAASVIAVNKIPATPAAAEPIAVKKGTSSDSVSATADAPMPTITGIAPAGNDGPLPNLMGGSSTGPAPVLQTLNVSQGISQGLLIKKVAPSYPSSALRLRIEGSVQLMATISRKGDIAAVKILSGDQTLAHAAADAVKQWKYKPYLLNGSPVEIQTQVTVNFKLPR